MKFVVNNCPFYIGLFNTIVLFNPLLLYNKCLYLLLFNSSKKTHKPMRFYSLKNIFINSPIIQKIITRYWLLSIPKA